MDHQLKPFTQRSLKIPIKLCPVKALRCYEERSSEFRVRSSTRNPLFISVKCPFRPVKAATIGHWLKDMMKAVGIDTNTFSVHSTRSASTSKAKSTGVPMSEILIGARPLPSVAFTTDQSVLCCLDKLC